MPADMYNVNRTKELIIAFIRARGPSLPVHIARDVNTSPLFAAAFLSELYNEGKIKMSHMKIGSSSLYYLPEQQQQLENFMQYLNQREKEALALLKKEKVLEDNALPPVTRVALRSLQDFAIPLKATANNEAKNCWKYFTVSDAEVASILAPPETTKEKEIQRAPAQESLLTETKEKPVSQERVVKEIEEIEAPEEKKPKKSKAPKQEDLQFVNSLKEFLKSRDIEITHSLLEKKKEFEGKIRLDTHFGKQEFYCLAKDKKKVTDSDLTMAFHKAQAEKMPALFLAPGDLDKKAIEYLQHWKNLIKFEKIK